MSPNPKLPPRASTATRGSSSSATVKTTGRQEHMTAHAHAVMPESWGPQTRVRSDVKACVFIDAGARDRARFAVVAFEVIG